MMMMMVRGGNGDITHLFPSAAWEKEPRPVHPLWNPLCFGRPAGLSLRCQLPSTLSPLPDENQSLKSSLSAHTHIKKSMNLPTNAPHPIVRPFPPKGDCSASFCATDAIFLCKGIKIALLKGKLMVFYE
ncbi:hypothetical protein CEXT_53231 [Caerostris extrusa]|uniref:Uncharacterized protein n=1 Tax=Caerostris extrusa TaxID=172846 RepID=A0AAV4XDF7_CAEEX|nr:hypothetical protein CEXT_53231 [Caerostris extrusa]